MRNLRSDFPILQTTMNGKPLVFLDSGASAQKPLAVIEAMDRVQRAGYANIHRGLYHISQDLTAAFEHVREQVAHFIGAPSHNTIVFTRNATESINLVAQSWGRTFLKSGDEIIISEMEHHANIVPWQILRDQTGVELKITPVLDEGSLDLEALKTLLSPKTKLVSLVHISNALGTINPIKQINEIVKNYNKDILTLFDGSQGVVHSPVNMADIGCDFYVFTGHKLYGPTGIGVLYGKHEILQAMPPYQGGGDMIETVTFEQTTYRDPPFKFEAGTPAIIEVIGLGAAIAYIEQLGWETIEAIEQDLLTYGTELLSNIKGLTMFGTTKNKAAIFSFALDGAHHSDVGMILDQQGIAVRTGHHCAMPLMKRFGVEGTVRASCALYNTRGDLDKLAAGIQKAQEMLA